MRKHSFHIAFLLCALGILFPFPQNGWSRQPPGPSPANAPTTPSASAAQKIRIPKSILTSYGLYSTYCDPTVSEIVRLEDRKKITWPVAPYSVLPFVTKWDMNERGVALLNTSSLSAGVGPQTQFTIHFYSPIELEAARKTWESTGTIAYDPAVYTMVRADPLKMVLFRNLQRDGTAPYDFDIALQPDGAVFLFVAAEGRLTVWRHRLNSQILFISGAPMPDSHWLRLLCLEWKQDPGINVAMNGSNVDVIGRDGTIRSFKLPIPPVPQLKPFWPSGLEPRDPLTAEYTAPPDLVYGLPRTDIPVRTTKPSSPIRAILKDIPNDTVYCVTDTELIPVNPNKPILPRTKLPPNGRLARALTLAK